MGKAEEQHHRRVSRTERHLPCRHHCCIEQESLAGSCRWSKRRKRPEYGKSNPSCTEFVQ